MYPKPRKVSVKWLTKRLECSEESRKICQGLCCKLPNMYAYYTEEEIGKVSPLYRVFLEWDEKEGMYRVKKKGDGRTCEFIDLCLERPEVKPIFCWLYLLKLDKNGNLVLHCWAVLQCPNYGRGEPLWKGFKESIIKAWGEEFYEKEIVAKIKRQRRLDEYVD